MAWPICHTQEAFDNARSNLSKWNAEKLINAISDDHFEHLEHIGEGLDVCTKSTNRVIEQLWGEYVEYGETALENLVDRCMRLIRKNGTCDNGGSNFWIDREGYHTVSVSKED